MLENIELGKHDFHGQCAPLYDVWDSRKGTFSVGIFKWVLRSDGKGIKRSAAFYRIRGYTQDAEKVYNRARAVCKNLDDGFKYSKKSEFVR